MKKLYQMINKRIKFLVIDMNQVIILDVTNIIKYLGTFWIVGKYNDTLKYLNVNHIIMWYEEPPKNNNETDTED